MGHFYKKDWSRHSRQEESSVFLCLLGELVALPFFCYWNNKSWNTLDFWQFQYWRRQKVVWTTSSPRQYFVTECDRVLCSTFYTANFMASHNNQSTKLWRSCICWKYIITLQVCKDKICRVKLNSYVQLPCSLALSKNLLISVINKNFLHLFT